MKPWENSQCTTNLSPWGGYSSWRPLGQHLRPQFRAGQLPKPRNSHSLQARGTHHSWQRNFGVWCFFASKKIFEFVNKTHDELRKYLKISMSWSWRLKLLRLEILVVLALAKKRGLGLKKMISFIAFHHFFGYHETQDILCYLTPERGKRANSKKNTCDSPWFCFFGFSLVPIYIYIFVYLYIIKRSNSWPPSWKALFRLSP